MPLLQTLIVLGLLVAWWWVARSDTPHQDVQRMLPWILGAIGILLPVEQALTGNGMLSANVALMLVVGGALILDRRGFIVFCAVLIGGWMLAVNLVGSVNLPVADQVTYIILGIVIAVVVFALRAADRARLEVARDAAYETAMRDPLTGLWNRRGLDAIVPSMMGGAHENSTGIWCMFIDVRGLKRINDTIGHAAGDQLLAAVGAALESTEVVGGVPVRWGGDEFCVIGVGTPPLVEAAHDHLQELAVARYPHGADWDLSLGIAYEAHPSGNFLADLVRRADEDMYRRRGQSGMSMT